MAVVTTKSTQITNRDATPKVLSPAGSSGNLKSAKGKCAAANGDSIASKLLFCSVPSNAFVRSVLLSCDAITSGAMDIGIYKSTADGGAVVDADFFASAQSIASVLSGSNVAHESGVFTLANSEKPLWEALGLTSDPGLVYDVVGTLTAAAAAAGTAAIEIQYV